MFSSTKHPFIWLQFFNKTRSNCMKGLRHSCRWHCRINSKCPLQLFDVLAASNVVVSVNNLLRETTALFATGVSSIPDMPQISIVDSPARCNKSLVYILWIVSLRCYSYRCPKATNLMYCSRCGWAVAKVILPRCLHLHIAYYIRHLTALTYSGVGKSRSL